MGEGSEQGFAIRNEKESEDSHRLERILGTTDLLSGRVLSGP